MGFSSCIWVISSRLKRIWHGIGESIVHETTLTSTTVCITVNKLLLRKWYRSWIVLDSMSRSNATGRRESPATTTATLVLDWNNSTCGNPINYICGWCSRTKSWAVESFNSTTKLSLVQSSVQLHFRLWESGKFVISTFTCCSWIGIMSSDLLMISLPVRSSHFILSSSRITLSIGGDIRHELIIFRSHFTTLAEMMKFLLLHDLIDDTTSNSRSSNSTATDLKQCSFILHI